LPRRSSAAAPGRGPSTGLRPLYCSWPRFSDTPPGRGLHLAPLYVARDLGWCEHDYPRWDGHNTIQHTLLVVLGSPASLTGSELSGLLLGSGPSLCLEPTGLWPFRYHAWRGNLSREEVRDGPHSDNRCGCNRCSVASTAAPLRPQAGSLSEFQPFVVDRNNCHFLWYGGVAGDGLRSVGVSPPSKSVCSILTIAICGPGLYGAPAFFCAW
jgi:hypothetical protein